MSSKIKSADLTIFLAVIGLLSIGVVMVFSSSAVVAYARYQDSFYFLKKQLLWALLGLVAMFFTMQLNYRGWRKWSKPFFIFSLILLALVLVPGVGTVINGARRWISIGPIQFQPSEVCKLAIVLFMADWLAKNPEKIRNFWKGLVPALAILGLVFGLIMGEPDLGTSLVIFGTVCVMLFATGAKWSHLGLLASCAIPLVGYLIKTEPYRFKRLTAFINPWKDPLDTGFHIIQSLFALGSGGLFGLGLGRSRQKFFYLPENHTDFIFAILGEELGFIGAATVLCLFFLFAWRGYRTAVVAPDMFGSLLAVGITSLITLQALINIGVVTSSIPVTGITLPFISFGGTSLVFMLAGVGILLNISKHVQKR